MVTWLFQQDAMSGVPALSAFHKVRPEWQARRPFPHVRRAVCALCLCAFLVRSAWSCLFVGVKCMYATVHIAALQDDDLCHHACSRSRSWSHKTSSKSVRSRDPTSQIPMFSSRRPEPGGRLAQ